MQILIVAALMLTAGAPDQSPDQIVESQRRTAAANIKALQNNGMSMSETSSLIVCTSLPESKAKSIAAQLEKQLATANTALQYDKDDHPWAGKLTVYLFADRQQFRSFVRQIEKRSPDDSEQTSQVVSGNAPHVAVGPGRASSAASVESQAGAGIASAVLSARMRAAPLPDWVTTGFARAVTARAANQSPNVRKKAARDLVRARVRPREAWGDALPEEQRLALGAAIIDFLTFGGGAKPAVFLGGFRPDDQKPTKTAEDALSAVNLTVDQFEAAFVKWLATAK